MKIYSIHQIIFVFCLVLLIPINSGASSDNIEDAELYYRIIPSQGWSLEKNADGDLVLINPKKEIYGKLIVRYLKENRRFESSDIRKYRRSIFKDLGGIIDQESKFWSGIRSEICGPDDGGVYSKLYYFSDWNYGYLFIFRSFSQENLSEAESIISHFETFVPWRNVFKRIGFLLALFLIPFALGWSLSTLGKRRQVYKKYISLFKNSKNDHNVQLLKSKKNIAAVLRALLISVMLLSIGYFFWTYGLKGWPFLSLSNGWLWGYLSSPSVQKIHKKVNFELTGLGTGLLWTFSDNKIPPGMIIDPVTDVASEAGSVDIDFDFDF